MTFGVFASGFLIRPLGGFVLGYFGDLYGRRKVLIFTTTLMSVSTCLIAFIPTYEKIGIMAPIILIIMRLMQGFAIGGLHATRSSSGHQATEPKRDRTLPIVSRNRFYRCPLRGLIIDDPFSMRRAISCALRNFLIRHPRMKLWAEPTNEPANTKPTVESKKVSAISRT